VGYLALADGLLKQNDRAGRTDRNRGFLTRSVERRLEGSSRAGVSPRPLLALRSPPRSNGWRVTFPEDACSGETPHRWAQTASERRRSGLSPAATKSEAAVSGPTPNRASRSGAMAVTGGCLKDLVRRKWSYRHRRGGRPTLPMGTVSLVGRQPTLQA
jgi:hypothetical protein